MGRKNLKEQRRKEIVHAFARVLANHGFAGATMQAVASEAGLAPGLLHHYFANKDEMLHELLATLLMRFRERETRNKDLKLNGYVSAALALGEGADQVAAKCWVGLLAEAIRSPALMAKVKRHLEGEIDRLCQKADGSLNEKESSAVLAYVLGCLVFGAFAPKKTAGFALVGAAKLIK